jgi:hypothetical protein
MSAFGGKVDISFALRMSVPDPKWTLSEFLFAARHQRRAPMTVASSAFISWAWVEKHQGAIVAMGGPLGKTKKITQRGIESISNDMGAFTVVRAESNEAAAKLFENHPHFTIFPGEAVEVMPVLPIPGA